jgi:hypothetical protein
VSLVLVLLWPSLLCEQSEKWKRETQLGVSSSSSPSNQLTNTHKQWFKVTVTAERSRSSYPPLAPTPSAVSSLPLFVPTFNLPSTLSSLPLTRHSHRLHQLPRIDWIHARLLSLDSSTSLLPPFSSSESPSALLSPRQCVYAPLRCRLDLQQHPQRVRLTPERSC